MKSEKLPKTLKESEIHQIINQEFKISENNPVYF